jgi:CAAX prenyl protease-like protein
MFGRTPSERAYFAPFIAFYGVLLLGELVRKLFDGHAHWAVSSPQYWIHPIQIIVCGAMLVHYWPHYEWRPPRRVAFTVIIGIVAFVLWVSPLAYIVEHFFPKAARVPGFDPAFFGAEGWPYFLNVGCRFVRLVIIVPLVEEIFWRGFLLRWWIRDEFTVVPFGTYQRTSFFLVTFLFMLEHTPADYPAALLTGALFNFVALHARSLSSCVLVHAITNLLLGIYILRTGQTGFW